MIEILRANYSILAGQASELENLLSLPSGYQRDLQLTKPPNSEIICGQNVGTKVVCGMILFFLKESYAENLKKIVGAV